MVPLATVWRIDCKGTEAELILECLCNNLDDGNLLQGGASGHVKSSWILVILYMTRELTGFANASDVR